MSSTFALCGLCCCRGCGCGRLLEHLCVGWGFGPVQVSVHGLHQAAVVGVVRAAALAALLMRLALALALALTLLALVLVLGSGAAGALAVAGLRRGAVVALAVVGAGGALRRPSAVAAPREPLQVAVAVVVMGRRRVLSPARPGRRVVVVVVRPSS